jgi:hypothetical protein
MILSKNTPSFTSKFNEIYGHASVLRKYMNVLDEDLVICGQVQHGWCYGAKSVDPSPLPLYVWNDRSYAGVRERGQDAHLIGSPFIYGNFNTEPEMSTCSLLAFPDHSTVGCRYESRYAAAKEYAEWLSEIRKTEGFTQITVALHYNDYFDYTTTSVFNRYGIAVVTCGSPLGSADFLQRMVDLMRKHSIVTSNVVGTAIFYASFLGQLAFVGGPIPTRYGLNGSTELASKEVYDHDWAKKEFPTLICGPQEATVNKEVGMRELGLEHKKMPFELWDIVQMCYMKQA